MATIHLKQQLQRADNMSLHDSEPRQRQHQSDGFALQEPALESYKQRSFPSFQDAAAAATGETSTTIPSTTATSEIRPLPNDNAVLSGDDDHGQAIMPTTRDSDNPPKDADTNRFIPPSNYSQRQHLNPSPTGSKGQLLQRQLEYYFSRQNLISDTYLVSQMDSDLYVPIATIAKFKRVTNITLDMDFIISVLRRSSLVTVDDTNTMVKPNVSTQRTTVILRDVPESTEKEIKQFLTDLKSPPVKHLKEEYANMWYLTFGSEEDALKLLHDCRGKSFKGQHVAARMKFEPLVGSIQAQKSALQTASSPSTPFVNTTPSTHLGQNHHITDNNNHNKYYSGYNNNRPHYYNAHMKYGTQYPAPYPFQPEKTYYNYNTNGTGRRNQKGGRYMDINNASNNKISGNRYSSAQDGRKHYKSSRLSNGNSHGDHGKNGSTGTNRHIWRTKSQAQQNQVTPCALDSSLPKIDASDKSSTMPLSESSLSSSSQHTKTSIEHSRYKSGNDFHRQMKEKGAYVSSHWIQKQQDTHQDTALIEPTEFSPLTPPTIQYSVWSNDSASGLSQPSVSSETKSSLSASSSIASSRRGSFNKVITSGSTSPASPLSPNSETVLATNAPVSDISESLETRNRKPKRNTKWNKKKKNAKPHSMDNKDHSQRVANQPDIQSSIYFPPLPINNNVSQTAVSSVAAAVTHALDDQQQASDIVNTGCHRQTVAATEINDKGNDNNSNHRRYESIYNRVARMEDDRSPAIKQPQQTFEDNHDSIFPVLCPMQKDAPRPPSSLSYADMLMKTDGKTKVAVV